MSRAISIIHAQAARHARQAQDAVRIALVSGCAIALVMAGRALPF